MKFSPTAARKEEEAASFKRLRSIHRAGPEKRTRAVLRVSLSGHAYTAQPSVIQRRAKAWDKRRETSRHRSFGTNLGIFGRISFLYTVEFKSSKMAKRSFLLQFCLFLCKKSFEAPLFHIYVDKYYKKIHTTLPSYLYIQRMIKLVRSKVRKIFDVRVIYLLLRESLKFSGIHFDNLKARRSAKRDAQNRA